MDYIKGIGARVDEILKNMKHGQSVKISIYADAYGFENPRIKYKIVEYAHEEDGYGDEDE